MGCGGGVVRVVVRVEREQQCRPEPGRASRPTTENDRGARGGEVRNYGGE